MTEPPPAPADAAQDEALRRGLPPGSRRHLAVLFAGSPARDALVALYAFEAELRRIVDSESHEAAHARLQWWRAELDRLAGGRATHPIAQALQASNAGWRPQAQLLHESLVAADLDLARFTYHEWTEVEAYCFRSGGAVQILIATVLAGGRALSSQECEFARRLGSSVRQVEMLEALQSDLRRGRIYAPLDSLRRFGIEPAELGREDAGPACRKFEDEWRARVREDLLGLPALLGSPAERSSQRHGLVLASLYARRLERPTGAARPRSRRLDLEPLDRLWTAWRTAVRNG
jgi:phytoene synthase